MEKFKITFYPDNKTIEVAKDTNILSAALSAGVYINSSCGGDGVCGRCKIILKKGSVLTQPTGRITLQEKKKGVYLACLTTTHSDLEVLIPPESRLDMAKLKQEDVELRLKGVQAHAENIETVKPVLNEDVFKHSALTAKLYLELPRPGLDDNLGDLERVYREIRRIQDIPIMQTGLVNIRMLNELLRASDWKITVTLGQRNGTTEIVLIEPSDTSQKNFGFAFDIGTTTVSGQLVNLKTKEILGTKASYNKQSGFGSDVITRIIYAQKENGLEKLHYAVTETMNEIIQDLVRENNLNLNDITGIFCTGNTTMIHLLLRIDPSYIRREPYIPTVNFPPTLRCAEAGIKIMPRGLLSCAPSAASYVGGDITAGILACGIHRQDNLNILIDIGTNGEIALGSREFLTAAAASAGPAFEGSGVTCGMRATNGAIQKVKIIPEKSEVEYAVIGNAKPKGICGSGYIDLICELLRTGIIDKNGKIQNADKKRIREGETGREFVVAFKKDADASTDIVITEADIENLKRAKAAIYSAMSILIRHMGLDFSRINKFFIAGGFGTYIDIEKSIHIGLLPDLERSKFVFVGNSSLAGARLMLLSQEARQEAEAIAKAITYFELSVDPVYMDEYTAALFFPHTDINRFPSVRFTTTDNSV